MYGESALTDAASSTGTLSDLRLSPSESRFPVELEIVDDSRMAMSRTPLSLADLIRPFGLESVVCSSLGILLCCIAGRSHVDEAIGYTTLKEQVNELEKTVEELESVKAANRNRVIDCLEVAVDVSALHHAPSTRKGEFPEEAIEKEIVEQKTRDGNLETTKVASEMAKMKRDLRSSKTALDRVLESSEAALSKLTTDIKDCMAANDELAAEVSTWRRTAENRPSRDDKNWKQVSKKVKCLEEEIIYLSKMNEPPDNEERVELYAKAARGNERMKFYSPLELIAWKKRDKSYLDWHVEFCHKTFPIANAATGILVRIVAAPSIVAAASVERPAPVPCNSPAKLAEAIPRPKCWMSRSDLRQLCATSRLLAEVVGGDLFGSCVEGRQDVEQHSAEENGDDWMHERHDDCDVHDNDDDRLDVRSGSGSLRCSP